MLWKYVFYEPSSVGLFNTVLGWVHLGPYGWLQSPGTAMPALVVESTWANAGATVIIYLAALTAVDTDLYDAASVDGAGLWHKIWHITLPQLRGVLLITLILQIIGTAQVFLEPYLFTSGGPANSTLTVLLLVYQYAFGNSVGVGFGHAAALSLMLAAFLALFSVLFMWVTRSGAPDDRLRRRRDDATEVSTGGLSRTRTGAPRHQVALRFLAGATARAARPDRARAGGLAREGCYHADRRHPQKPACPLPARRRLEQPQRGVDEGERRPLFLEHRRSRARVVVLSDRRRDDRCVRALGAPARGGDFVYALLLGTSSCLSSS